MQTQSYRHPLYAKNERRWKFLRAAYVGGAEWYDQGETWTLGPFTIAAATGKDTHTTLSAVESNRLWRHEREKDVRYQRRLRMSVYENIFRPHIDTLAASIAKACKKLDLPPQMEYLHADTDRWGCTMQGFRLRRLSWAHVFGHVGILLDKPTFEGEPPPSEMHERAAGIRTYCQILTPLAILDWQRNADHTQSFDWAYFREQKPAIRTAPDEPEAENPEEHEYTRLLRPGLSIRYRDGVEYERTSGPPFVPLVVQFAQGQDPEQAEPVGVDCNGDVADLAELRFNKKSWLTDQEASQCFNQASVESVDGIDKAMDLALGTHTYVGAKFSWQAPDVAPMQHLMQSIDRDAGTSREMMGLETKGETSQAAKSGVALQMEGQNISALFSGYATAAQDAEERIWRMAAELEGVDPDLVVCEYASDFSAMDANARFQTIVTAIEKGGFTGKALAELQKQLWMAANPDAAPELQSDVFEDIDAGADESLVPVVPAFGKPPGGNPFGGSPAESGTEETEPESEVLA
jgi:hypothetical protein